MSRVRASALLLILFLTAAGCVSDGKRARSSKQPRQPDRIQASTMEVYVGVPRNTNSNLQPDTLEITIFLFNRLYPIALAIDGTFTFTIEDAAGNSLMSWGIPEQMTKSAQTRLPPGPGYPFMLSILDRGSDEFPSPMKSLLARFEPSQGGRVLESRVTLSPLLE